MVLIFEHQKGVLYAGFYGKLEVLSGLCCWLDKCTQHFHWSGVKWKETFITLTNCVYQRHDHSLRQWKKDLVKNEGLTTAFAHDCGGLFLDTRFCWSKHNNKFWSDFDVQPWVQNREKKTKLFGDALVSPEISSQVFLLCQVSVTSFARILKTGRRSDIVERVILLKDFFVVCLNPSDPGWCPL